jgi:hypothetical protein
LQRDSDHQRGNKNSLHGVICFLAERTAQGVQRPMRALHCLLSAGFMAQTTTLPPSVDRRTLLAMQP